MFADYASYVFCFCMPVFAAFIFIDAIFAAADSFSKMPAPFSFIIDMLSLSWRRALLLRLRCRAMSACRHTRAEICRVASGGAPEARIMRERIRVMREVTII